MDDLQDRINLIENLKEGYTISVKNKTLVYHNSWYTTIWRTYSGENRNITLEYIKNTIIEMINNKIKISKAVIGFLTLNETYKKDKNFIVSFLNVKDKLILELSNYFKKIYYDLNIIYDLVLLSNYYDNIINDLNNNKEEEIKEEKIKEIKEEEIKEEEIKEIKEEEIKEIKEEEIKEEEIKEIKEEEIKEINNNKIFNLEFNQQEINDELDKEFEKIILLHKEDNIEKEFNIDKINEEIDRYNKEINKFNLKNEELKKNSLEQNLLINKNEYRDFDNIEYHFEYRDFDDENKLSYNEDKSKICYNFFNFFNFKFKNNFFLKFN